MTHHGSPPYRSDAPDDPALDEAKLRYRQKLEDQRAAYRAGAGQEAIDREAAALEAKLSADAVPGDPLHLWEAIDRLRDLMEIRGEDGQKRRALDARAAEVAANLREEGITSMAGDPAGRLGDDLRRARRHG